MTSIQPCHACPRLFLCLGSYLAVQRAPGQMVTAAKARTPPLGPSGLACSLEMFYWLQSDPQGNHIHSSEPLTRCLPSMAQLPPSSRAVSRLGPSWVGYPQSLNVLLQKRLPVPQGEGPAVLMKGGSQSCSFRTLPCPFTPPNPYEALTQPP